MMNAGQTLASFRKKTERTCRSCNKTYEGVTISRYCCKRCRFDYRNKQGREKRASRQSV